MIPSLFDQHGQLADECGWALRGGDAKCVAPDKDRMEATTQDANKALCNPAPSGAKIEKTQYIAPISCPRCQGLGAVQDGKSGAKDCPECVARSAAVNPAPSGTEKHRWDNDGWYDYCVSCGAKREDHNDKEVCPKPGYDIREPGTVPLPPIGIYVHPGGEARRMMDGELYRIGEVPHVPTATGSSSRVWSKAQSPADRQAWEALLKEHWDPNCECQYHPARNRESCTICKGKGGAQLDPEDSLYFLTETPEGCRLKRFDQDGEIDVIAKRAILFALGHETGPPGGIEPWIQQRLVQSDTPGLLLVENPSKPFEGRMCKVMKEGVEHL